MNNEPRIKKAFVVVIIVFLLIVSLCGCTENYSSDTNDELSKFLGTWSGNMETFMFDFRQNSTNINITDSRNITSANITELEFTLDNLYMTISTGNETQEMSYKYLIEENRLFLSPKFDGEPLNGEPPFNGEPPIDGEYPPFNESNPLYHDPPNNGTRPNFNDERPFRKSFYNYEFNEELNILYLDGSPFIKN